MSHRCGIYCDICFRLATELGEATLRHSRLIRRLAAGPSQAPSPRQLALAEGDRKGARRALEQHQAMHGRAPRAHDTNPVAGCDHLTDHDLERYHLGMVADEEELGDLEEHLLICRECVARAEACADYVDALRGAACRLPETEIFGDYVLDSDG